MTGRIAYAISSRPGVPAADNPISRGFRIAMEELAERGEDALGWDSFDDEGDPERAAENAHAIVADPSYVAVVGPMGSTEALATAGIYDQAGMLQVSPCASHPQLCRMGYRTFHRLVPNEEVQGAELARMALDYLSAPTAGIVHDQDAFGTVVADNFTAAYEGLGGQVVARESVYRGQRDFRKGGAGIGAEDPALVFFAVHAAEGLQVAAAIRELGVRAPFLGTDGMKTAFFLGGGKPGHEAYHTHSGADFRRLESAAEFRRSYVSRYPEDSTYSPEGYDAAMLVDEAVRRAGSTDRAAVLLAFRETGTYQGITGLIAFDGTGERVGAPVSFYQVLQRDAERDMAYLGLTRDLAPPGTHAPDPHKDDEPHG